MGVKKRRGGARGGKEGGEARLVEERHALGRRILRIERVDEHLGVAAGQRLRELVQVDLAVAVDVHLREELLDLLVGHRPPTARARQHRAQLRQRQDAVAVQVELGEGRSQLRLGFLGRHIDAVVLLARIDRDDAAVRVVLDLHDLAGGMVRAVGRSFHARLVFGELQRPLPAHSVLPPHAVGVLLLERHPVPVVLTARVVQMVLVLWPSIASIITPAATSRSTVDMPGVMPGVQQVAHASPLIRILIVT